jgi:hypothetical protein
MTALTGIIKTILGMTVPALTPIQRWEAARRFGGNGVFGRWFVLISAIALIVLAVLFFIVSLIKGRSERRTASQLFVEYAQRRGLSTRESQILLDIANKAGLKRIESIFSLPTAFDRGVAKMEKGLENRQKGEQSNQFKIELSYLREKLGFRKRVAETTGVSAAGVKPNSRQIPIGKKVYMTRRRARDSGEIESMVTKNSEAGLEVELKERVKITFGESWIARYYFGASVWEFDTSIVSYDGNILVLNHNDDVRFINRRRFLRVPVRKRAFIAQFPFAKSARSILKPPEFVPAVITELAGPGLRIESKLQVQTGQRVLVVFDLGEDGPGESKIVEDIGEIRHTRDIPDGLSIAVELTGLNDSETDELIRATNSALVRSGAGNEDTKASRNVEEGVGQPAAAQGA